MALLVDHRIAPELPIPVAQWLEAAWPDGIDPVTTLTLSGPVSIRRGRLRLRGDTTMRFDLGRGYVSDIRIGFGRLTAMRGLDALVDDTGITVVGHDASMGFEIDQGTFLALWCESLLFPTAWALLPGLRWTPFNSEEAIVSLPFRGGVETVSIDFRPDQSPFPVMFHAERYREVGGPKVCWRAEYGEWRWQNGIAHPTRLRVRWGDEAQPWFDMRVESITPNEPLAEHETRAREAIIRATSDRASSDRSSAGITDNRG